MHHPLQHQIRAKHTQCIYHRFEKGDFGTFEIFIVDSDDKGRPQAGVQIEGPVAGSHIGEIGKNGERQWDRLQDVSATDGRIVTRKKSMGALIQDSIQKWPNYVSKNARHFQDAGIIHHAFHIDYTHSGENEDAIAARADISRQKNEEKEERRQRKEEGRDYKGDENVDDEKYEEENQIQQVIPDWIEPYEWTKPIKAPGWYRMCVQADSFIAVEMDIRSSADLGGIDPETWHVYTHDEREDIDEEERSMGLKSKGPSAEEVETKLVAEELDKALKNQVRDYDLASTRKLMEDVQQVVSQMQKKQRDVQKRIKSHEGDAKRNYRKILRSGMMETVLYIVITLFQVYTVHKWLLGSNMLGR